MAGGNENDEYTNEGVQKDGAGVVWGDAKKHDAWSSWEE